LIRPTSGFGPSPTSCDVRNLVAIEGKAEVTRHHPIGQCEIDGDSWIRAKQIAAHWADVDTAERHRRTHTKKALRFGAATRQCGFGGVNLRKDALRSFVKFLPFFCQRETASAAGNQTCLGSAL
jgi:hypothetical protein